MAGRKEERTRRRERVGKELSDGLVPAGSETTVDGTKREKATREATKRQSLLGTHSPPSDYCIQHNLRHCLRGTSHTEEDILILRTGGKRRGEARGRKEDVHFALNNPRQPFLPGARRRYNLRIRRFLCRLCKRLCTYLSVFCMCVRVSVHRIYVNVEDEKERRTVE